MSNRSEAEISNRGRPALAVIEIKLDRQRRGCGDAPQPQSFAEGEVTLDGETVVFHSGFTIRKLFACVELNSKILVIPA
jgi:hypothetical protein